MVSWSNRSADSIINVAQDRDIILIYSGMSGVNHAAYITSAIFTKYGKVCHQAYIRKNNEKSHGLPIETDTNITILEHPLLVFVDDFISSGTSMLYCVRSLIETNELNLTDTDELLICAEADYCYGTEFFRRFKNIESYNPIIVTIKDLVMFTKFSLKHSTFYTSKKEYRAWSKYRKMYRINHVNS